MPSSTTSCPSLHVCRPDICATTLPRLIAEPKLPCPETEHNGSQTNTHSDEHNYDHYRKPRARLPEDSPAALVAAGLAARTTLHTHQKLNVISDRTPWKRGCAKIPESCWSSLRVASSGQPSCSTASREVLLAFRKPQLRLMIPATAWLTLLAVGATNSRLLVESGLVVYLSKICR
jgi:hypothetical protein